jgi:hypothetical protein
LRDPGKECHIHEFLILLKSKEIPYYLDATIFWSSLIGNSNI